MHLCLDAALLWHDAALPEADYIGRAGRETSISISFNASILAPIVEEALFRGLLYAALRKYFGVLPAMALTSLLFAGVHVNIISLVPIGLLSAVLCGVYEKRGSLWDPIIVHALFNTTSLVLLSSSEIFRPP